MGVQPVRWLAWRKPKVAEKRLEVEDMGRPEDTKYGEMTGFPIAV